MKEKTMKKSNDDRSLIYQLDGRPPLSAAIPIGLQHVFAMFIGNLAPILVLSGVVSTITGNPIITPEQRMLMIRCCMFASGVSTIVQLYPIKVGSIQIGARLPIVMGTSFGFMPTLTSIGNDFGISVVLGSVIAASLVEVLMGVFIKYIKKFFSPIVIGSVLMSIGLYLLPVGVTYFAGGAGAQNAFARIARGEVVPPNVAAMADRFASWQNLLMGGVVFLVIVLIQRLGKGTLKASAILIGIIVGYILAIILGQVNFAAVGTAKVFALPVPFSIIPSFKLLPILSMAIMVVVSGIETMGHVNGMTIAVWDRPAGNSETQGALIADGLANIFSGIFGVLPNTSFGQNIGIVCITKVVNRFCILITAIVLILAGFSPKVGAVLSAMPDSVLGGAVITVFAMIMLNGIKMISKAGFSERNVLILALTFGVGYAIGSNTLLVGRLPSVLNFIFRNPTVAVCVISMTLNLIFPLSAEDKAAAAEAAKGGD
jgi:NCS2 family nucleobase:cation symporter-2